MKKVLAVLAALMVVFSMIACDSSPTGPDPNPTPGPTVTPTDPPAPPVVTYKVWPAGVCSETPCQKPSLAPNPDGSFDLHRFLGGYYEGYGDFLSPCTAESEYWSEPALSLLEREPITGVINFVGTGNQMFVSGGFDGRGPEDPRHQDPATLHVRTACGSLVINSGFVVHQVE